MTPIAGAVDAARAFFIVLGESGEYDDYSPQVLLATDQKALADRHVERINNEFEKFQCDRKSWSERLRQRWLEMDPKPDDYSGFLTESYKSEADPPPKPPVAEKASVIVVPLGVPGEYWIDR